MNVGDITMEEPNIQARIKYSELKLLKRDSSPQHVSGPKRGQLRVQYLRLAVLKVSPSICLQGTPYPTSL